MKHFALKERATGKLIILHSIADNFNVNAAADMRGCDVLAELGKNAFPTSREFREAWTLKGDCIGFDCGIVQESVLSNVRSARAPILDLLHKKLAVASSPVEKKNLKDAIKRALDVTEELKGADIVNGDDVAIIDNLKVLQNKALGQLNDDSK